MASGTVDIAAAVDMWYSEVSDCDWSVGCQNPSQPTKQVGHFTAMIWKSTSEFACAYNKNFDAPWDGAGVLYVCRYLSSPPNFGGQSDFEREVQQTPTGEDGNPAVGTTKSECETKVAAWMAGAGKTVLPVDLISAGTASCLHGLVVPLLVGIAIHLVRVELEW
jgi:hypothetical protein